MTVHSNVRYFASDFGVAERRRRIWVRQGRKLVLASTAVAGLVFGGADSASAIPDDGNRGTTSEPVTRSNSTESPFGRSDSDTHGGGEVSWSVTSTPVEIDVAPSTETPTTYGAVYQRPALDETVEPDFDESEIDADNVVAPGIYRSPGVTAIVGTPGSDQIFVGPGQSEGSYQVDINGEKFALEPVDVENLLAIISYTGSDTIGGSDLSEMVVTVGDYGDAVDVGAGNDRVFVGGGNDLVFGRAGNDFIDGDGGDDYLEGNDGEDVIVGQAGDDIVRGGPGNDRLGGGTGDDTVEGNRGDDLLVTGSGDDTGYGGPGVDKMYGEAGNDYLDGGPGADELWGMQDQDILTGGLDDDNLNGGLGDDTIIAGPGEDIIFDRTGDADTIYTDGNDRGATSEGDRVIGTTIDLDLARDQISLGDEEFLEQDFADRVESDLVTLRTLPTGQAILQNIESGGKTVQIVEAEPRSNSFTHIYESPDYSVTDQFTRPDGVPGPGVNTTVFYGTANAADAPVGNVPLVEFGHELIHSARSANGTVDPGRSVEFDDNGEEIVVIDEDTGARWYPHDAELQVVDLPYQHGHQRGVATSLDVMDRPDSLMTENNLRADINLPPRRFYEDGSLPVHLHDHDEGTSNLRLPTSPPDEVDPADKLARSTVVAIGSTDESTNSGAQDQTIAPAANLFDRSVETDVGPQAGQNSAANDDTDGDQPAVIDSESETPRSDTDSTASGPCGDSDGDGWGWNGQSSCKMQSAAPRFPSCQHGSESDPDGDGFGWESDQTCLIN